MDASMVSQVRRFNRTVTQRVGALDDQFLARDRPLGQARLLWEIGPDGAGLRSLRARLDLDSGYLSRLLRALEADGVVTVGSGGPSGPNSTGARTARPRRSSARSADPSGTGWSARWPRSSGSWWRPRSRSACAIRRTRPPVPACRPTS